MMRKNQPNSYIFDAVTGLIATPHFVFSAEWNEALVEHSETQKEE